MYLKRILRDLMYNPLLLKGKYSRGEERAAIGLGWLGGEWRDWRTPLTEEKGTLVHEVFVLK